MDVRNLATGLGWLSIGLGIAELFAPRAVAQIAGTRNHRSLIRGYGLREIASGIGILEQPQQPAAVWSRVVGDALDLAALGVALASPKNDRTKTLGAIAAAGHAADLREGLEFARRAVDSGGASERLDALAAFSRQEVITNA